MTAGAPELQFIMERVRPGNSADCFEMWACRGAGRGCPRNKFRKAKKHCADCVHADKGETVGALQKRLRRGDA